MERDQACFLQRSLILVVLHDLPSLLRLLRDQALHKIILMPQQQLRFVEQEIGVAGSSEMHSTYWREIGCVDTTG